MGTAFLGLGTMYAGSYAAEWADEASDMSVLIAMVALAATLVASMWALRIIWRDKKEDKNAEETSGDNPKG